MKKNSTLSYGAHLFKDIVLLGGDFNVDAHGGPIPKDVFEELHDKRAEEWVNSVQENERTEYNFLIRVLSGFGKDGVVDFLKEAYEGKHPNTYGDSFEEKIEGENGEEKVVYHAKETILTAKEDFNSHQCLDYFFQILPSKEEKMRINGRCKVKEFFVKGSVVSQLSDHYGVELCFNLGQFNNDSEE